jgi:hypothetical protein
MEFAMREKYLNATPRFVPLKPSNDVDGGDDDSILIEGHKPLVPDAVYTAKFTGWDTAIMFARAPKVFLKFEVVAEATEYNRVRLIRPYRVRRLTSRPGPNGKFVLSAGGDLYRTLAKLLDTRARPDRISLRPLRHMLFRVYTRTVDHDRNGAQLPDVARYSVIAEIEDGS